MYFHLFFHLWHQMVWAPGPAALAPLWKPTVPLQREPGGTQRGSEHSGEQINLRPCRKSKRFNILPLYRVVCYCSFGLAFRILCTINPLNAELNPICYLLALLAHHFLHVSRIRVKSLTLRQASGRAARLLRSWVRIPPGAWIFVCCECRVLSGRGLCDELSTRPEESYRLCCVVVCDLETSRMGAPYIYDISRLKVNDLTLILLTWRKWWAPNNASK